MKYFSYLNTAKSILQLYKGTQPFGIFLKDFFRQHKKYGSKDRKQIGHLCYCYFRSGNMLRKISLEEGIIDALFLCSTAANDMLQQLNPGWNEGVGLSVIEKCKLLDVSPENIFPFKEELSVGIDYEKFNGSLFVQPDLFLRIRPGFEKIVPEKLNQAGIPFKQNQQCIAISNSTKIEEILTPNQEVVIQDYNSQQVGVFLQRAISEISSREKFTATTNGQRNVVPSVWDCCAASGGKSIMLHDLFPAIRLTVSDLRKNILINLEKRFATAGIKKYRSFVADLSGENVRPGEKYDMIIVDAPCSGSGTWGRTPEQLFYFDPAAIDKYKQLQKKITKNVIPCLAENGKLIYITCSVFKKENEEMVDSLQSEFDLHAENIELLKGDEKKADTMFVAVLSKKN